MARSKPTRGSVFGRIVCAGPVLTAAESALCRVARITTSWIGVGALIGCMMAFAAPAVAEPSDVRALQQLIDGPQRTGANRDRDRYRSPLAVLSFLEVAPNSHVLEIWPGSAGYWTEILAPYLKDRGRYIAALPKPNPERPAVLKSIADTKGKLAADSANYSGVVLIEFSTDAPELGAPSSVDYLLTFRNLHNWMATDKAGHVLAAFHRVLRTGGILGIEEHRGRTDQPQDPAAKSGYVREDFAIALIEKAGFRFLAKSEALANPKDTKDHPAGVWTLPPSYRLKDQDRAKYTAIGESDRFLMKFEKR